MFLVLLYSVFLAAIVASGAALALGLVANSGPLELSAIPATAAGLALAIALGLAARRSAPPAVDARGEHAADSRSRLPRLARVSAGADLAGAAVRDALALIRTRDARLVGAVAYWGLDAAVLWAMLHAFGAHAPIAVIVLAYFVGQVANTLPIPGSVSGGIAGVLIAFGVGPAFALPAVIAYRTVAVWLPTPVAIVEVPALRATIARWQHEKAALAGALA